MCCIVKRQYEAAYFTVEASLILPAVMLFTVMMIFLGFYSYDRCVMEHSAYEAALRGTSSHYKTAQEAEAAARTAASRLVEEKLFAIHDFQYNISVDAGSVTVTYHCIVNMPFFQSQTTGTISLRIKIYHQYFLFRFCQACRQINSSSCLSNTALLISNCNYSSHYNSFLKYV